MKSANVVVEKLKVIKPEAKIETVESAPVEPKKETIVDKISNVVTTAVNAVIGKSEEMPGVPGVKSEADPSNEPDGDEGKKEEDSTPCPHCQGTGKCGKKAEEPEEDDKKMEEPEAKPEDKKQEKQAETPVVPKGETAPDLSLDSWRSNFGFTSPKVNSANAEFHKICEQAFNGSAFKD